MYPSRHSNLFVSCILLPIVMRSNIFQVMANVTVTNSTTNRSSVFQPIKPIFYDLATHEHLKIEVDDTLKLPIGHLKFSSRGPPCDCYNLTCECCTGIEYGIFDLNQTCASVVVEPEKFAIQMLLHMNGKVLVRHTFSGKNPPPLCYAVVPFPIKLCVRFYNIHVVKKTLFVCTDLVMSTDNWSVLMLHFDCMAMDLSNGPSFAWVDHPDRIESAKPLGNSNDIAVSEISTNVESVIYDEVSFEPTNAGIFSENSTLNPVSAADDEEDQIGTFKL